MYLSDCKVVLNTLLTNITTDNPATGYRGIIFTRTGCISKSVILPCCTIDCAEFRASIGQRAALDVGQNRILSSTIYKYDNDHVRVAGIIECFKIATMNRIMYDSTCILQSTSLTVPGYMNTTCRLNSYLL